MNYSGVNSVSIKEINRALVLKLICTNKDVSRIWLANETGLTRMTLSNIINRLTEQKFLCNVRDLATENVVGRRPVKVDLDPSSPVVAGISISRDMCTGMVMDLKAHMVTKTRARLCSGETKETLLSKLIKVTKTLVSSTDRKILGLGVSTIGTIDIERGMMLYPTDFYGICNVPIKETLEKETGIETFLLNEMSAAALAEKYYGSGVGVDDFIYIGVTNGIGAGIVAGGELFLSRDGFSGEFGHTSISFDGPKCSCGNRGCIELYASVPNMIKAVNKSCGAAIADADELNAFALQNDTARDVLTDIMRKMGLAATNAVNFLSPTLVIFGDAGCALDISWYKMVEETVNGSMLARENKKVTVVKSRFGVDAPVIGSATIVADLIFSNRLKVLGEDNPEAL